MTRRLLAWGPAAIWAAVLFLASSKSSLPVDLSSGLDKIAHFGAYLVFGLFAALGATASRFSLKLAAAICWLYALTDELHQSFVAGRYASFGDWIADAAGAVAGILLFSLFFRRWRGTTGSRADLQGVRTT